MSLNAETRSAIEASLAENPGQVIEFLADEHDVSPVDVIDCLPEGQALSVLGEKFESVMTEISRWGEITFLVHTADLILEAKGEVPKGSFARGYFNLSGKPIGGHLKADNCVRISFISRPLFGNDTHSVQFFNADGGCMFKIYLGRDEERKLISEQVQKYLSYREGMQSA